MSDGAQNASLQNQGQQAQAQQGHGAQNQAHLENLPRTLWWEDDAGEGIPGLMIVDQTRLPLRGDVLCCNIVEGVEIAIKSLAVRGAPALGVAGAYGLALWAYNEWDGQAPFWEGFMDAAQRLANARPTAINLSAMVNRVVKEIEPLAHSNTTPTVLREQVLELAHRICREDEASNRALGSIGATLLKPGSHVLTICNAGSLATSYYGTALGVIYAGFEQGLVENVWACETRPANQGGRLTIWELMMAGVPSVLIADSMAASIMAKGWVDAVIVGADRICANGDVANKIGTYALAVLAKEHGIPFYVAAPSSTIDANCAQGADVPIEQRDSSELEGITISGIIEPDSMESTKALDMLTLEDPHWLKLQNGHQMQLTRKGGAYGFDAWFRTTPPGVTVYNPAFDVTPARYISAIITERGIVYPTVQSGNDGQDEHVFSFAQEE